MGGTSIFLIAAALIAGMVRCGGGDSNGNGYGGGESYTLTIAIPPAVHSPLMM